MKLNDKEYSKVTGQKHVKKFGPSAEGRNDPFRTQKSTSKLIRWLVSKNACFWMVRGQRSILLYFGLDFVFILRDIIWLSVIEFEFIC